jgi:hypothetical protein
MGIRVARIWVSAAVIWLGAVAPFPAAAQDDPEKPASITGIVLGEGGEPQAAAVVRLRRDNAADRVQVTDSGGAYTFADVTPGRYTVDALPDGFDRVTTTQSVAVAAGTQLTHHILIARSGRTSALILVLTIAAALVYLFIIYLFRRHGINTHARAVLRAQIKSVGARLQLEAQNRAEIDRLSTELHALRTEWDQPITKTEAFFWSGRELIGWTRIHELERQLAVHLVPAARVFERAHTAEAELRAAQTPEGIVLADRIRLTAAEFARTSDGSDATLGHDRAAALLEQLKQQLTEALAIIYDERDTKYAGLMELQNKAMWIANIAVLAIILLATTFQHEHLFLFGAIGGLLSRMARVVLRQNVPTDYGDSWTTLFLSPLVGAISAWFGIVLIVFLTQQGVLGNALAAVSWTAQASDPTVMALALLLGFSERLFTSLLTAADSRMQSQLEGKQETPVAPAAASAPLKEAVTLAAAAPAAAVAGGSASTSADVVVTALDLTSGERAAFIGDPSSPRRETLRKKIGRENVFDLGVDQLKSIKPVDAVLLETLPDAGELAAAAKVIASALAADGRLVVVGSTPARLYDAAAKAQKDENQVGPAFVTEILTAAGLLAQEPPEQLGGSDPVRWAAAFVKPAVTTAG